MLAMAAGLAPWHQRGHPVSHAEYEIWTRVPVTTPHPQNPPKRAH
jgi:hypothetical protein